MLDSWKTFGIFAKSLQCNQINRGIGECMKTVALNFTFHTDLIEVSDDIFQNIYEIRKKFDKWLYDKSNNHDYWICVDGKKRAVSFDTEAFIHYLNDVYTPVNI